MTVAKRHAARRRGWVHDEEGLAPLLVRSYHSGMGERETAGDTGAAEDREDVDLDQIIERLSWSPAERLQYLLDMLAFEERARLARPIA